MYKTIVNHWRYDTGWHIIPEVFRKHEDDPITEYREEMAGWHCWVYPGDDIEFTNWMHDNMKEVYECSFRFNSGDPMFTVLIKDDEDASLFKLRWV
jgi:hypothetical protein